VYRASLTQDGQSLVWHVDLGHPFSPAALEREKRALCLLIERARHATTVGMLCVEPPGRAGRARLEYFHVLRTGPGAGHYIDATVTRASNQELTAVFLPASIGVGHSPLRWQVLSALKPPACTPVTPNPLGCTVLFPVKPKLAALHAPQLVGCVPSRPPFIHNGPTYQRVVALTFDDGPWPDTPQFLAILEREHVHATFFQIGEQVGTYGRAVDRRMLADGDMIGDHTWNHADVAGGGSFAAGEISQAAAAIRAATGGFQPCLFRAPGGAVSRALILQARAIGFTTIQWDVDPRDWSRPGTNAIYQNVVDNARPGAIVIQHDGGGDRSQTLDALPREIDTLRSKGYQFVTITHLLGQQLLYR
jgi:peptidoglycan/xylan/chitin deacetylase (PgdA/CDA1 family)